MPFCLTTLRTAYAAPSTFTLPHCGAAPVSTLPAPTQPGERWCYVGWAFWRQTDDALRGYQLRYVAGTYAYNILPVWCQIVSCVFWTCHANACILPTHGPLVTYSRGLVSLFPLSSRGSRCDLPYHRQPSPKPRPTAWHATHSLPFTAGHAYLPGYLVANVATACPPRHMTPGEDGRARRLGQDDVATATRLL